MKLCVGIVAQRFKKMAGSPAAHLVAGILFCLHMLTSCYIGTDMEECTYNVHLNYRYFYEMSSSTNVVDQYVESVTEYIFDDNNVLYMINTLPGSSCGGPYVTELELPPGRYSVVSWANVKQISRVSDAQVGITEKQDMGLYPDDKATRLAGDEPGGVSSEQGHVDSERLYYGYRTLSVYESGVTRVPVDMFHAHFRLTMTIRWKSDPPPNTRDFYVLFRHRPVRYSFMPEYTLDDDLWMVYDATTDDYPQKDSRRIFHSPERIMEPDLITRRKDVYMNVDKKIEAEFVTYRHGSDSQLLISLYAGNTQIMKEIDLQHFFTQSGIDLTLNYRQEFHLQLEIDGDKVAVGFVSVGDWEEGGAIGTG